MNVQCFLPREKKKRHSLDKLINKHGSTRLALNQIAYRKLSRYLFINDLLCGAFPVKNSFVMSVYLKLVKEETSLICWT